MRNLLCAFVCLFLTSAIASAQPAGKDISMLTEGVSETSCYWGRLEIAPGEEKVLAEFDGAGAVKYFYITDGRGGIQSRNLILRMYWDGNDFPSVNVPLADFFGAIGGKVIDYDSRFMSIYHNCHQCYFPMPFSNGARITLYNDSEESYVRDVAYNFDCVKDEAYSADRSRFHAVWNRSNPTDGLHTILDVTGHGHYVGNIMHVYTESRRWWGEGDTDFIIDGKPMKHTPGTEDEYGACFDLGGKFNYSVCGYIQGGILVDEQTGEYSYHGHNRVYRWYEANPVRFSRSLKVTIQNQYVAPGTVYDFKGQQGASDDYTTIAYYYMDGAFPVILPPYEARIAASEAKAY